MGVKENCSNYIRCKGSKLAASIYYTICQEIIQGVSLVWHESKPSVIKLLAHLVVFTCAALCVAAMLIITYGLLGLCDLLFKETEVYVKVACVIGEVLLSLYILRFTAKRSMVQCEPR